MNLNRLFKKRRSTDGGFTLVEMMVSVALFVIIMMVLVDLFISLLVANRKAQSQKFVYDNVYSSIEIITRHIRSGTGYNCPGGACSTFSFTDADSNSVTYRVQNGVIERSMNGSAYDDITAGNITIDNLKFYTFGDNVTQQERVLVIIAGKAGTGATLSTFTVQTTISQALLTEF